MNELTHIETVIAHYEAVFCDVWGVVHNGVHAFEPALEVLYKIRQMGKKCHFLNQFTPTAGRCHCSVTKYECS